MCKQNYRMLFLDRRAHRERNRPGRSVAVAIDVDDDLLQRYTHAFSARSDDPLIRLVGDKATKLLKTPIRISTF